MWNLCMDNEDNRARLGNEGACELIMDALRHYSSNKYVVEAATGCLVALSEDNPENTLRVDNYQRKLTEDGGRGARQQVCARGPGVPASETVAHQPAQVINSE